MMLASLFIIYLFIYIYRLLLIMILKVWRIGKENGCLNSILINVKYYMSN